MMTTIVIGDKVQLLSFLWNYIVVTLIGLVLHRILRGGRKESIQEKEHQQSKSNDTDDSSNNKASSSLSCCPICLDDLDTTNSTCNGYYGAPTCGHVCHETCYQKWIKTFTTDGSVVHRRCAVCPVCKIKVSSNMDDWKRIYLSTGTATTTTAVTSREGSHDDSSNSNTTNIASTSSSSRNNDTDSSIRSALEVRNSNTDVLLNNQLTQLRNEHNNLQRSHTQLQDQHVILQRQNRELYTNHTILQATHLKIQTELMLLTIKYKTLQTQYDVNELSEHLKSLTQKINSVLNDDNDNDNAVEEDE